MEFIVTRTSKYDDEQPCDGVTKKAFTRVEVRTIDEDGFNAKFGVREGLWKSKGENHGTTKKGWVRREFPGERIEWVIDLPDMDSLMSFVKTHGRVVMEHDEDSPIPEIEIYDDYRE